MSLSDDILKDLGSDIERTASYIVFKSDKVTLKRASRETIFVALPDIMWELSPGTREKVLRLSKGKSLDLSELIIKKIPLKDKKKAEPLNKELEEGLAECILVDIEEEYVFFNTKIRAILDTKADMILRRLQPSERREMERQAHIGRASFDAIDIRPVKTEIVDGFIETVVLNLYKLPKWRETYPTPEEVWSGELPPLLEQMIDTICENEESKKALLLWMAKAVTGKNETFLQLRGIRGNGKTTLAYLLMAIIGSATVARQGIDKDGFNGYMKGKRAVLIDDDKGFGTYAFRIQRKNMVNEKITYNSKNEKIGKAERQYTNYIVASNLSDPLYVEYDERRMTFIDLTSMNLDKTMDREDSSVLREIGSTDDYSDEQLEFLAQAGHYFLEYAKSHAKEISTMEPRLNDVFWRDVINSLGEVKRTLVDRALTGLQDKISYLSIKAECEKQTRFNTLAEFAATFEYKGELLFSGCDVKNKVFEVNPVFLKDEALETFDEEVEIENL